MPQIARRDSKGFKDSKGIAFKPKNYRCYNCGRRDHICTDRRCPARNIECHGCKVTGHFESCCRLRSFKKRSSNDRPNDILAVGKETSAEPPVQQSAQKTYYAFYAEDKANVLSCKVGGVNLDLLVDSGSDANLIPETIWNNLKQAKIVVRQCTKGSSRILKGYASDSPLHIVGTFAADVKVGNRSVTAEFYVVKGGQSLLGDSTSKQLGILKIGLDAYEVTSTVKPFSKIKDVKVQIHMNPHAKPVFQPIRRAPIPLEDAVNQKLEQLLIKDIIEVKEGPASWVSPLVVVGKTNGEPRICLDLRRVNEAVLRERHPMPVVDEYLARLGKGKYWSKLDIRDAFLQVELAVESRDVTVFITNKGLFRFKRLPFGLVTAPEMFQKVMNQILAGCEGTSWYLDDVIVEGATREEHDERLNEVR